MTPEFLTGFFFEAIKTAISLAAPMLLAGLLVGVVVSIFQSVTSINEMTMTFIPKMLAVACAVDGGDDGNLYREFVYQHCYLYSLISAESRTSYDRCLRMISLSIPLPQLQMFFLIFFRVGSILMTMPIFKSKSIPVLIKAGLALATSMALFPILNIENFPAITGFTHLAIGIFGEILLGLSIGLAVNFIFAGLQLAGQLAGYQMGMALARVMDPSTNRQMPLLGQFNELFALLIFITINAHHKFIRALADSYQLVPPFGFRISGSLIEQLVAIAGNMFVIAVKLGAPIIAVLLLTSIAFGLIARTVPQMNVFFVAMPLKLGVGLLFIGLCLPYFSSFLKIMFSKLGDTIMLLIKAAS
jgi:flagellar biosynthetic protein FliR